MGAARRREAESLLSWPLLVLALSACSTPTGTARSLATRLAAATITCPKNSRLVTVQGTPQCVCKNSKAHWVRNACRRGNLKNAAYLDPHNAPRVARKLPTLPWNATAANAAYLWAMNLKVNNSCGLKHPGVASHYPFGQNLAIGTDPKPQTAINAWGGESVLYTLAKVPDGCQGGRANFGLCGHYTQMMWNATTSVGCASIPCNGQTLVCCNYFPRGNVIGRMPYNA